MNEASRKSRESRQSGRGAGPGAPAGAPPNQQAGPVEEEQSRWEGEGGAPADAPVDAPETGAAPGEPDYKDRWLRAEAELQNFRRRASREWDEARRGAEESVLLELAAMLDDLERAVESARGAGADESWAKGVALVAQRVREYLGRQGVTIEDPLGRPFDPAFHEALLEVDATPDMAPGTVAQVVQKGFRRGDRPLRAARVIVARTPGSAG
jgi:molecular chaperone GrpE